MAISSHYFGCPLFGVWPDFIDKILVFAYIFLSILFNTWSKINKYNDFIQN